MMKKFIASITFLAFCCQITYSQVTISKIDNFKAANSKAKLLGKTKTVRESVLKPVTSREKKNKSKIEKSVPNNFKGRRNKSKAVYLDKEHQGIDPVYKMGETGCN